MNQPTMIDAVIADEYAYEVYEFAKALRQPTLMLGMDCAFSCNKCGRDYFVKFSHPEEGEPTCPNCNGEGDEDYRHQLAQGRDIDHAVDRYLYAGRD